MNAPPDLLAPNGRLAPVFTLGSALRWLGHDCSHCLGCGPIDALAASVWFLQRGPQFRPSLAEPLILIETGEFRARIAQITFEVACCSRGEGIRVHARPSMRASAARALEGGPHCTAMLGQRSRRPYAGHRYDRS